MRLLSCRTPMTRPLELIYRHQLQPPLPYAACHRYKRQQARVALRFGRASGAIPLRWAAAQPSFAVQIVPTWQPLLMT